jgi:transposase
MKCYVVFGRLACDHRDLCRRRERSDHQRGRCGVDPNEIANWLERLGLAFERVGGDRFYHLIALQRTQDRGVPPVCIDSRRLHAVTKTMRIKNDRNGPGDRPLHARRLVLGRPREELGQQVIRMLLTNRRTLQITQIDIENEIRETLRVLGIKLTGRITAGPFEARVLERS